MAKIEKIVVYKCKWECTGLNFSTWTKNVNYSIIYQVISQGISGWGESSLRKGFIKIALKKAKKLLKTDPLKLDLALDSPILHNLLPYQWYNGTHRGVRVAREGFSLAIHDLAGKLLNKPVYSLLNRPILKTQIKGMPVIHVNKAEVMAKIATTWYEEGFNIFKVKLRGVAAEDIEAIKAILGLASDIKVLIVDSNYGYKNRCELIECGKELSKLGVSYFQNPFRCLLMKYPKLSSEMNMPFSADNTAYWPNIIKVMFFNSAKLVNLHPNTMGGVDYFYKTVDYSGKNKIPVIMGGSGMAGIQDKCFQKLAFTLNTEMPTEGLGLRPYFVEKRKEFYNFDYNPDILENPLKISSGQIYETEENGFGIDVNKKKLERITVDKWEIC